MKKRWKKGLLVHCAIDCNACVAKKEGWKITISCALLLAIWLNKIVEKLVFTTKTVLYMSKTHKHPLCNQSGTTLSVKCKYGPDFNVIFPVIQKHTINAAS